MPFGSIPPAGSSKAWRHGSAYSRRSMKKGSAQARSVGDMRRQESRRVPWSMAGGSEQDGALKFVEAAAPR